MIDIKRISTAGLLLASFTATTPIWADDSDVDTYPQNDTYDTYCATPSGQSGAHKLKLFCSKITGFQRTFDRATLQCETAENGPTDLCLEARDEQYTESIEELADANKFTLRAIDRATLKNPRDLTRGKSAGCFDNDCVQPR